MTSPLGRKVQPSGSLPASIMIVGEAPGADEERQGTPFVGLSGQELSLMLHEAGINRSDCFITNVCRYRPPGNNIAAWFLTKTAATKRGIFPVDTRYPLPQIVEGLNELENEIKRCNPRVIIALGDTALWALTGESGITKWRGSLLDLNLVTGSGKRSDIRVIPTYHPAAILRKWDWRPIAVHDLRRAVKELSSQTPQPSYNFTIRPSFSTVTDLLNSTLDALESRVVWMAVDIETRKRHIACLGIGTSPTEALCIPFMCVERSDGFFLEEEELALVGLLQQILTHQNARVIWQNGLYDLQYISRYWGFTPRSDFDTMIAQGVCWPGMPKGLDFLSSMYCEFHRYWKDESKEWSPKLGEEQLWIYNCKDCCTTFESAFVLMEVIKSLNLQSPFDFEMSLVRPLLYMMLRGVKFDKKRQGELVWDMDAASKARETFFTQMIPNPGTAKSKTAKPWYRSPQQLAKLFYHILGVKPVLNRKTGKVTTDDNALTVIGKREPVLLPLTDTLAEYRSLGVFSSTFVQVKLDRDGYLRCSYNPVGTETFRFNSSADAFGYGTNLQNIPKGDDSNKTTWLEVIK